MSISIEVTTVGDSAAILLPKDLLERLRVRAGDRLTLSESADGFEVKAVRSEFSRQMEIAEQIMRENHDLLRRLAE